MRAVHAGDVDGLRLCDMVFERIPRRRGREKEAVLAINEQLYRLCSHPSRLRRRAWQVGRPAEFDQHDDVQIHMDFPYRNRVQGRELHPFSDRHGKRQPLQL